jgi:hypothetical protein
MEKGWNSIRDRVNKLVKAHIEFNEKSKSGSGRAESYSVKIKLLDELLELKEAGSAEKDLKKEALEKLEQAGNDIRKKAMQNRRSSAKEEEKDGEKEKPQQPLQKRRKNISDVMGEWLSGKLEIEKARLEDEAKFKMAELELKRKELELQEMKLRQGQYN